MLPAIEKGIALYLLIGEALEFGKKLT